MTKEELIAKYEIEKYNETQAYKKKLYYAKKHNIALAEEAYKRRKHHWFYNEITLIETYLPEIPEGEGWHKGRLPYDLWSEERKISYREKHKIKYTPELRKRMSDKAYKTQKNRVAYTNGEVNRFFMQGEEIPEGFYPGWSNHNLISPYKGKHWVINERGKREWQK